MKRLIFACSIFVAMSLSPHAETVAEFFSKYPMFASQSSHDFPTEAIAKNLNGTGEFKLAKIEDPELKKQQRLAIIKMVALAAKKNTTGTFVDPKKVIDQFMLPFSEELFEQEGVVLHNAILGTLAFIALRERGSGIQKSYILDRLGEFGYGEKFLTQVSQQYSDIYTVVAQLTGRENVQTMGMDPQDSKKQPKVFVDERNITRGALTGQLYTIDPESGKVVSENGDIALDLGTWATNVAELLKNAKPSSIEFNFHSAKGWLPQQWSIIKAINEIVLMKKESSQAFLNAMENIGKTKVPLVLPVFNEDENEDIGFVYANFDHIKLIAPNLTQNSAKVISPLKAKVKSIVTTLDSLPLFDQDMKNVENLNVSHAFGRINGNPFAGWKVSKTLQLNRTNLSILEKVAEARINPEVIELSVAQIVNTNNIPNVKFKKLDITVYESFTDYRKIIEVLKKLKGCCKELDLTVIQKANHNQVLMEIRKSYPNSNVLYSNQEPYRASYFVK